MRLSMSFATLAALAASLAAGPAVVREDFPPVLDDFSAAEASSFARLANAARGMIDRPRWDFSDDLPAPRESGPIPLPLITTFSPSDNRYRHSVTRINLRGGPNSRFLRMVLTINCGGDSNLAALLDDTEGDMLNDVLEDIFGLLSFEQVRHPSQKRDLREQMIIRFNEILQTNSIRDVYYHTFVIY
jgi:hypothetical protein